MSREYSDFGNVHTAEAVRTSTLCDRRDRYEILTTHPWARYNQSKTKAKFQLIVQMVQKKKHTSLSDSFLMCSIVCMCACVCVCMSLCEPNARDCKCVFSFYFFYIFGVAPLLAFYLFIFFVCYSRAFCIPTPYDPVCTRKKCAWIFI